MKNNGTQCKTNQILTNQSTFDNRRLVEFIVRQVKIEMALAFLVTLYIHCKTNFIILHYGTLSLTKDDGHDNIFIPQ